MYSRGQSEHAGKVGLGMWKLAQPLKAELQASMRCSTVCKQSWITAFMVRPLRANVVATVKVIASITAPPPHLFQA